MAVDISPTTDGGVLKEIIRQGTGDETPGVGSYVRVHYVGTLLDGTKFDSSRDRGQPFEFDLGLHQVIKAWDIGIATMKKGELAILTCAPDYAYGKGGSPPTIPPDATLKFEIEMIDWIGEDLSPNKDKGITRTQIVEGQNYATPSEGSLVEVHLIGKYNDQVFEERDVTFTLGEGEVEGIIYGIEVALEKFKKGEKSLVKIKSKYAFKNEGEPKFNIPPNADIEYEITLKTFEKAKEAWSLDGSQKIEQAKMLKDKGTTYFKENRLSLAIKMYQKVITMTNDEYDYKEEPLKTERKNYLISGNLNLALCYLKTKEPSEAKEACNKVLELDPCNEKALFRRGLVFMEMASPDLAIKDFQRVLDIEPKNTAAAKQIVICNNIIKTNLVKEKKLYANMFDKFAKQDLQKEEKEKSEIPDVMQGTLGVWGQEDRPGGRDATAFEKENPNILMLNANGSGEFKNM